MTTEKISYLVEFICWESDLNEFDTDGEAKTTNQEDTRTHKIKSFNSEELARDYIDRLKKWEGKWLAWVKLMRVISTELPIR